MLGKLSGRSALNTRLVKLGHTLSQGELDDVFKRFKNLADKKKGVTDEDIQALLSDELHQPSVIWELADLQVRMEKHLLVSSVQLCGSGSGRGELLETA